MTHAAQPRPPKIGAPNPFSHIAPCPPFLISTTNPPIVRLLAWAEPGPSTPPKHAVAHTENWDDDFEDKSNSPARQRPPRSHHRSPKLPEIPEPENWDDELDGNRFVSPNKDQAWDSSDDEDGLDFADQQEDKTVTARPRRSPLGKFPPSPPVPPLPRSLESVGETFPGSPTMSVFFIPSGRKSVTHSSLAHLPLRAARASTIAMLPPSPPTQREHRRLRKKSRPSDNNVFELLERQQDIAPLSSPPQSSSPSPGPPVDPSTFRNLQLFWILHPVTYRARQEVGCP